MLTRYRPALKAYLMEKFRYGEDQALDLLQDFVLEVVLKKELIAGACRIPGTKFRSYILCALHNFATSEYRRSRGSGFAERPLKSIRVHLSMKRTVGRACPQRAESDVFQARRAARRDGLALPGSWGESMVIGPRKLPMNPPTPCPSQEGILILTRRTGFPSQEGNLKLARQMKLTSPPLF